jgi:hypothetical protein
MPGFEIFARCELVHFGRIVEEHPLRKLAGEIIRRHADFAHKNGGMTIASP